MIYFESRTGNVRSIVERTNLPNTEITANTTAQEPFLLATYTNGLGEVPVLTDAFMKENHALCKGVIVSGNKNFGHQLFCAAADILSERYSIPIVCKIDLRGFLSNIETIQQYYEVNIIEAINQTQ